MTNWHDNIPAGGVLCKDYRGGIHHITHNTFITIEGVVQTMSDLTPLTADEWWRLAPWNYDMDSAPKDESVLLKNSNGRVSEVKFIVHFWWDGHNEFTNPVAWLPLQENKQ